MPRWLLPASRKSREPAVAESYVVRCTCGRVVRGRREADWQEVICDRCGEAVFVLPRNVYPEVAPASAVSEETAALRGAHFSVLRVRGRKMAAQARALPARAARVVHDWARRARRQVTRLRLITVGATGILLITAWWVWSGHAREQAQLTLRRAVERGESALSQGDLAVAAVEFRQAAQALDVLGRQDTTARQLRQLDRECQAATHLATASIPEMLEEAQRARENNPSADWADRFRTAYGGRWIVLDTTLHRLPGNDARPGFRVEYPLSVGGLAVVIEADVPAFQQLSWGSETRPVIFAAPAVDCRLTADEPKRWIIRLDGQRGFLWSRYETYQGLGFVPDEFRTEAAVRELLAEQSQRTGLLSAEVH